MMEMKCVYNVCVYRNISGYLWVPVSAKNLADIFLWIPDK